MQHPRFRLIPGNYTDDTQMSIAIAEVIVAQAPWTAEVLAQSFVTAFKRDPRHLKANLTFQILRFFDKITVL
ncbi:ADP-ribosylation/crystallin J1 (plasmid) [Nostoc linckia NIES-25]|nr:ADP-ribosylation/crystallin J1 [Nostoc linckia NIES-25]